MAAHLTSRLLIFLIFTSWVHQSSAKDTRQPDGQRGGEHGAEDSTVDERSLMPELSTMEIIMIVFVSMVAVVIIYKFYKKCPCF